MRALLSFPLSVHIMNTSASKDDNKPIEQWSVQEVSKFIQSIPGCAKYAENFQYHAVDGAVIVNMTVNDLTGRPLFMKGGPAICLARRVKEIIETQSSKTFPNES